MLRLTGAAALLLLATTTAFPDNIQEARILPQTSDLNLEAEPSNPHERTERCSSCGAGIQGPIGFPSNIAAKLQSIPPGAVVHSQSSFEECSTEKGCAGIKVKDGQIVERYGNADAFKAASNANTANEYSFHAGLSGNEVLEGGIPKNGPFWWMKENSPFRNAYNNYETISKSSSSSSSSGSNGGGSFTASLDLSGNPFLNNDVTKLASGFIGGQGASASFGASSSGVDIANNPFLNGKVQPSKKVSSSFSSFSSESSSNSNNFGNGAGNIGATGSVSFNSNSASKFGNQGFQGQLSAPGSSSVSKFSNVYTGSSPSPFTASTGSNVNRIQNTQKNSEFDFEQQQQTQQNIDEIFSQSSIGGRVEHNTGEIQQTCAGQGYVCVHKAQCNNGVVNTNGAGILQATTKKQYCNTKTEICCRIEVVSVPGSVQGVFNTASSQFGASGSGQSIFGTNSGSNSGSFGVTASESSSQFGSSSNSAGSNSGSFGVTASNTNNQFGSGTTGGSNGFKSTSNSFESSSTFGSQSASDSKFGATGSGFNAAGSNSGSNAGSSGTFNYKQTSFNNFAGTANNDGLIHIPPSAGNAGVSFTETKTTKTETDSFASGSNINGVGVYQSRKPGIPYLPPSDVTAGSSNTVSATATFTSPRPAGPGYLPPQGEQSINRPTFIPGPEQPDIEGSLLLGPNRQPTPRPRQPIQPATIDIPAGCAAALKCTPIEFCTAEGVISNTSVRLSKDQEDFRVPLTDCKDIATGSIGKCCRDSTYTDPWPTNQLGKWVPGVFGGDDGAYKPDSRGSPNNQSPTRILPNTPPTVGGILLNNYRTTTPKPSYPYPGPNQVDSGFGATQQTGQSQVNYVAQQGVRQQGVKGQIGFGSRGEYEQGQTVSQGFGQTITQGQGQIVTQGQGQYEQQGHGQLGIGGQGQFGQTVKQQTTQTVTQQEGSYGQSGQGQIVTQGQGQYGQAGQGILLNQGQGQIISKGQGQIVTQGQGQIVSQGQGQIISQGQGQIVSQGQGFGQVENAFSESVQRVFLTQYNAGGQCGLLKGQKPYGNRNDLEVDFAEIPWQAMVLLETNRSLLCGGVITRPEVVVTSAACVDGLQAKHVLIKGGEWKLGIDEEPLPFQIVQVKTILRHPGYRVGSLHNDVAILVLSEKLRFANNIYPICLPNAADTLDGFYNGAGECIVTGWGKQVLQAHIAGAIMHSLNVSLINPGECQAKISQYYPHLSEQYDADSCACGQPTNPINNICKVDIGSALACTTGSGNFVLRGVYSWDSGCQAGNQLAAFYKFDLEWYEWALGLSEGSGRFTTQYGGQTATQGFGQFNQVSGSGIKGGFGGIKGGNNFSQFSQSSSFTSQNAGDASKFGFGGQVQLPAGKYQYETKTGPSSSFSASYSSQEKQVFQGQPQVYSYTTKPEIITYTTKPEIITYTTKPKIYTYTTQPKIVTFTTKPQIVTYETSGSGLNPQYVAPGVTFNPQFSDVIGKTHAQIHGAQCQCENGK